MSQYVEFQAPEISILENQVSAGEKAREIKGGDQWAWLEKYILGALFDEAVMVLRYAGNEVERVKAQQMFLAAEKPRKQIDFLISQGDAARAALKELSDATLESNTEEQQNG